MTHNCISDTTSSYTKAKCNQELVTDYNLHVPWNTVGLLLTVLRRTFHFSHGFDSHFEVWIFMTHRCLHVCTDDTSLTQACCLIMLLSKQTTNFVQPPLSNCKCHFCSDYTAKCCIKKKLQSGEYWGEKLSQGTLVLVMFTCSRTTTQVSTVDNLVWVVQHYCWMVYWWG